MNQESTQAHDTDQFRETEQDWETPTAAETETSASQTLAEPLLEQDSAFRVPNQKDAVSMGLVPLAKSASRSDSELEEVSKSGDAPELGKTENTEKTEIQKRVKRVGLAALILSAGILCSRLLGYVREAVIAYQAGAGAQTDTYNAAFLLPDIMNHLLAGGTLSITFIPLFAGYLAKDDHTKANRLFSLIATTMGSLLLVAVAICWVFAEPLVGLLFGNFTPEQIAQTVEMTRIVLPAQVFHYLGGLMMAVLMAKGRFVPSAMAPLVYNLGIIGMGVLLGGTIGMKGFAYGALIGAFLGPFLIPMLCVRRSISYRPVFGFRDPDFKKYILLTLPLLIGVSLTTVDEWLGKIIGSSLETGSISWLNYARKLVLVPIAIVGQAAGQAALPYLSQLSARGEFDKAASTLHRTLGNVLMLSIVMCAFILVLASDMVEIVYQRGAFTADDTAKTASLLAILAFSIPFWTMQMVSVRAFYAAKNTLTPMILTTIVTAVSIPVYILLSQNFGAKGIAIASCIGMAMQALCVMYFYSRRNEHFHPSVLVKPALKGLALGAVAAGGCIFGAYLFAIVGQAVLGEAYPVDNWSFTATLASFSVCGLVGLIAVCIAGRVLVPEEFASVVGRFRRKLGRGR